MEITDEIPSEKKTHLYSKAGQIPEQAAQKA